MHQIFHGIFWNGTVEVPYQQSIKLLVPGTVFAKVNLLTSTFVILAVASEGVYKNLIFINFSQNFIISFAGRIWSVTGCCKLACAVSLSTVSPMPLQSDLLWLVAKKFQSLSTDHFYGEII